MAIPPKSQVVKALREIPDPELNISVWDLGLIYDVTVDAKTGKVSILMTLTTIGCPLFHLISEPIKERIGKINGVKAVDVDLTFEPPWTTDRMSDEAKAQLGF